nr:MAG: hypothetical protein KatS3mg041_0144 [Bacteroidota bacterium]
MSDLLLTHAYCLAEDPRERRIMRPYPPLGILYLSAYLKKLGFRVEVLDTTFAHWSEVEQGLRASRAPVVGIYTNLMTRSRALRLIRLAREAGKSVVVGGPDASNYPREYLLFGADAVVLGEGEHTLAELLPLLAEKRLEHAVAGAAVRRGNEILFGPPRPLVPDLDALPWPDREAVCMARYLAAWRAAHGMGSVSVSTARGCPYRCRWCSKAVFGDTFRKRSPERVADEVADIMERYRPESIWYVDDVFTIKPSWLEKYARELEKRRIRAPFTCITRADRVDARIAWLLSEMGCQQVWLGSESGSDRLLAAMERGVTAEQIRQATHLLQRAGIRVGLFVMLGYVGEGLRDIRETAAHLRRTRPDEFLITVAYPIKGTAFYREVADRLKPARPWEESSDRELDFRGRYGRAFYYFATRYVSNAGRAASPIARLKGWLAAGGMYALAWRRS